MWPGTVQGGTRILTRLQKVIADAGLASRREAERWIGVGKVTVNGRVVRTLGSKVDPARDTILVFGKKLSPRREFGYYLFHKPKNVLVARRDPWHRPLIYDYLKGIPMLVHPAGRLDFDSEGLLLLTNDGPLLRRITHPSSQITKTYQVKVKGVVSAEALRRLSQGVVLDDGPARARSARLLRRALTNSWLEIVMGEGRKREVRRMCEAVGHPVVRLRRVAIGPLHLKALPVGRWRRATDTEVDKLKRFS